MRLSVLYRGSLSSCNYGCPYCPFAKHTESRKEHELDESQLCRFVDWVVSGKHTISVLFTPWGEALIQKRYQRALARLTISDTVEKVAIQTNLSCHLNWIDDCNTDKLALWTTFHPGETKREAFVSKCAELIRRKVRFSVGAVGLKEHFDDIVALRAELPAHVYLWINAYKRVADYYDQNDIQFLSGIDPLFSFNNRFHESYGKACRAGASVISVDGFGTIKRCHFIPDIIGNIYDQDFESRLAESPCSNQTCGCHIGYVHLDELGLYETFNGGVLERIPALIDC